MGAAFAAAPVLTGVLLASTAATVGFSAYGAMQQSSALSEQARVERQRAQQFELQGIQQGNEILREQLSALAQSNVAAGASGIDPFTGSAAAVKKGISRKAQRQLSVSRLDSAFSAAGARSGARQLDISAQAAITRGLGQASGSLLDTATQLNRIQ